MPPQSPPRALIILAPGAEEIEYITIPDLLVRAGCSVVTAAVGEQAVVQGSRGVPLAASVLLSTLSMNNWDVMYVPGGMGSATFCRQDPIVQTWIRHQIHGPGAFATICAAPTCLLPGGFAKGCSLTSHPSVAEELRQAGALWQDAPVVVDGRLLTAQAAGSTAALGLALIKHLMDEAAAVTVAQAIRLSPDTLLSAGIKP